MISARDTKMCLPHCTGYTKYYPNLDWKVIEGRKYILKSAVLMNINEYRCGLNYIYEQYSRRACLTDVKLDQFRIALTDSKGEYFIDNIGRHFEYII